MTTTTPKLKIRRAITSALLKWTTPDNLRGADFRIFTGDNLVTNTYWALTPAHPLFDKLAAKFPHTLDGEASTGYSGRSISNAKQWREHKPPDIARVLPTDVETWVPIPRGDVTLNNDMARESRPFAYIVNRTAGKRHRADDKWALDVNLFGLIADETCTVEMPSGSPHGPWRISHAGQVIGWVMPIRIM